MHRGGKIFPRQSAFFIHTQVVQLLGIRVPDIESAISGDMCKEDANNVRENVSYSFKGQCHSE